MSAGFSSIRALLLCLAAVLMTGCAQLQMGAPVASIDNIQKAKASGISPVAVGSFALAPGKPAAMDQKVTVRSNAVFSPYASSFARYLQETLRTDLAAAGLLDPASPVVIEGLLLDSQLDVPVGAARALVAARITVRRSGQKVYEKDLKASTNWTAPFVGVEAIPHGINQYGLMYRQLVAQLLNDPEFRAAARR